MQDGTMFERTRSCTLDLNRKINGAEEIKQATRLIADGLENTNFPPGRITIIDFKLLGRRLGKIAKV